MKKKNFTLLTVLVLLTTFSSYTQNIGGLVVDINGETLIGVTVMLKGTDEGTVTDVNGLYSITNNNNATQLVFSYIGYQTQEIEIGGKTKINVVLREATKVLDDIVVVGYGHQKKVSITGSISTVQVQRLQSIPVATLSNALGGTLQGVTTQNVSGDPSSDATIQVRGLGTWTDTNPLILVDGIERNINFVNPQDVESLSVLKDASATAVYGVRGANGVILITTKKGKAGKARVTYRSEYAEKIGTRFPDYIKGWEFATLMNEALENEGSPIYWTSDDIDVFRNGSDPYLRPNVNWTDAIYNKTTNQTINTLNISGGTEVVRYYLSARHTGESGLHKRDESLPYNTNQRLNRYNLHSNIDVNITKDLIFTTGLSSSIQDRTYPASAGSDAIHHQTRFVSPILMPLHNPDGSTSGTVSVLSPWGMSTQGGYAIMYINTLQGTFSALYDMSQWLTKGLSISGKFSFDSYNEGWTVREVDYKYYKYEGKDENDDDIIIDIAPERTNTMRTRNYSTQTRQVYMDLGLNYDRTFGKHGVASLLVFNRQEKTNVLASDELTSIPNRLQGVSGRVAYNFDLRYFAEINIGRNGSENFKRGHRYGWFPAFSAGWIVSNEKIWNSKWFSNLKIRGSWGKVGNDYMGTRFAYLTTINKYAIGYPWGTSHIWDSGYIEDKIGTENVTWETAKKTNIGLDLGFFNNNLSITVDVFKEFRENIFMQRQSMSYFAGFLPTSVPWGNLGKVENKGVDGKIDFSKSTFFGLNYSFYGTFSFARNKIIQDDVPPQAYHYLNAQGLPMGQTFGLVAIGFFTSEEIAIINEEDRKVANGEISDKDRSIPKQTFQITLRPGDIKYEDQNGDGIINDNDRRPIGYPNLPEIMFGFGGTLNYKGWDLSVMFNGVGNRSIFLQGVGIMPYVGDYPFGNILREYYDNRYIPATANNPNPDNSNAKYPAVIAGPNTNNYRISTLYMRDASYLRLQNLEIGYSLPKKWLEKIKISSIRMFGNGNNLFVIDKIKITDPEMINTGTYPKQIVLNLGIQIDF